MIESTWNKLLKKEYNKEYFKKLIKNVNYEYENFTVFPKKNEIFKVFRITPFEDIKVVILGQDPYHGDNQANGLCFSVNTGVKLPPSLLNIYKELQNDLGYKISENGDLINWAKEGVCLLNSCFTVRKKRPGSHKNFGWEIFTDEVIKVISENKENVIFILWGSFAKEKEKLIDTSKHYIIKSVHPSPFSANNGFFNSKPFSKTNQFLKEKNIKPINWEVK